MIGEHGYAPWVYEFSRKEMPALGSLGGREKTPANYGWHPSNQYPNQAAWGSYGANSLAETDK